MSCPIILVHGGGHGGWCWDRLRPVLASPATAVDLPPRSIRGGPERLVEPEGIERITVADWATAVLDQADSRGWHRFVLAGHSLGGLTLAETARRAPERVAHLIYVSATVPAEGATVLDMLPPEFIEKTATGLDDATVRDLFCSDMDEEQARFVIDHVGTEVITTVTSPVTREGLSRSLPATFVRLRRDRALPPDTQGACIARLRQELDDVSVVEIDAGHNVMISRPHELARVLDRIALGAD
jgi:pimeloyl-ACP methyl ester carboxylesterase